MSVLAKLKDHSVQDSPYAQSLLGDDHIARFVCDEDGLILYGNQAFEKINPDFESSSKLKISDFIEFVSEDDFYQSGQSHISLLGTDDVSITMNWVQINSETKILIASLHDYNLAFENKEVPPPQAEEEKSAYNPFSDLSDDIQIICSLKGEITNSDNHLVDLIGTASIPDLLDITFEEDRQSFETFIQHLRAKPQSIKIRLVNYTNDVIHILWRGKNIDGQIYLQGRNISEREQYRQTLADHQQRLKEAEALGNIGQWEWTIGTDYLHFSDQLCRIFGIDEKDPNPKFDYINAMIHEDDEDRMMQVFQRAMIEQKNYDLDFKIETPQGQTRHIKCEGRCKTDQNGEAVALYGIMQDMTHVLAHEQGLIEAKERAEKAYASKTQFLANISHELRTPLNAVIGFSEMMERQLLGPIGTEKYLEYIKGIRESGEHLLSLIGDILDMSKIEAGKYDLHLEKFNVIKTAQLAAHMVEGRAVTNNVKLDIQVPDEKMDLIADRRAVMQIILNLLSNAVKFSHENGVVDLIVQKNENFIFITVKDRGIGIPANKLATITQPFEQAQNHLTREYEGTGLGLTITKELIEIHGGNLKILSEVNAGTEVIVKLPKETKLED
ncbi:MAG: ATP-binding protein [Pseudomonadota bacterium]